MYKKKNEWVILGIAEGILKCLLEGRRYGEVYTLLFGLQTAPLYKPYLLHFQNSDNKTT